LRCIKFLLVKVALVLQILGDIVLWEYRYSYSAREFLDIAISWLVATIAFSFRYILVGDLYRLFINSIAVFLGFVLHELAHRWTARRYGCIAFYRAWYLGLLIALIVAIASRGVFVFIAPGAVMIYSPWLSPSLEASIALSGPYANIAIALISMILAVITNRIEMQIITDINIWLAFFNLLPIPPLDGYKALRGSIIRWVIAFAIAIALMIINMRFF